MVHVLVARCVCACVRPRANVYVSAWGRDREIYRDGQSETKRETETRRPRQRERERERDRQPETETDRQSKTDRQTV